MGDMESQGRKTSRAPGNHIARKTCDCRPLKPSSVNAGNSRLLDREFGWDFNSPLWNRHYFLFADEPPEGLSRYFPTSPFLDRVTFDFGLATTQKEVFHHTSRQRR
jgi:hypothetical protein